MKKTRVKQLLGLLIFFLIFLGCFIILKPAYDRVSFLLKKNVDEVSKKIENEYGFSISYDSFSLSIFSSLNIKKINIVDTHDDNEILEIKKVVLRYDFLKLISLVLSPKNKDLFITEKIKDGLKDLTIDGVNFDINADTLAFLKRFQDNGDNARKTSRDSTEKSERNFPVTSAEKSEAEVVSIGSTTAQRPEVSPILNNVANLISSFPIDVFIKNVHIQYYFGDKLFDAFLKRLNLASVQEKNQLNLQTLGSAILTDEGKNKNYSAVFSLDGNLNEKFDGSVLNVKFSDITDGNFRLNRLNLRFNYNDKIASFRTIQNAFPFYLQGSFNVASKDADLSLRTENLTLSNVVSVRSETPLWEKINALALSLAFQATYNTENSELNYNSEGNLSLAPVTSTKKSEKNSTVTSIEKNEKNSPMTSTKNSEVVSATPRLRSATTSQRPTSAHFLFSGNDKHFNLETLDINSDNLNASANGDLVFRGLKFNGNANLYNYTLPNGGVISTELYFNELENGFMCFAPQVLLDEKSFSAMQLSVLPQKDSIDFSFEISDYAHYDTETPGTLKIDGSYLLDTKYLQASVNASSFYLDSIAQTGAFFARKRPIPEFTFLKPYLLNTEIFVSSDLKTLSYNVPYIVVANSKKDNQFFYISLDGNNSSLQLSQFDFITNGKIIKLSGMAEKLPDEDAAFVMLDANFGTIPYHFSGKLNADGGSLSGDYGFAFDFHKSGDARFDGSLSVDNLPVDFSKAIFAFSLDTAFSYSPDDSFKFSLARFFMQEAGGSLFFAPKLELTNASVTKYGAFLNKIKYSDIFSELEGKAETMWNVNDGIFDSVKFSGEMKGTKNNEEIAIQFDASNPDRLELSKDFFLHSMYLNSQLVFKDFELNRFSKETNDKNLLNAIVIATGTLDNPYLGLNVDSLSFKSGKQSVTASANAFVEEKVFKLENASLKYNRINVSDISASFDLSTFAGKLSCVFDTTVLKKTIHAPIEISLSEAYIPEGKLLPSEIAANINIPEVSGTFILKPFAFQATLLHSNDSTAFFTSDDIGISGSISNSGEIAATIADGKPLKFNASGKISDKIDIDINNLSVSPAPILSHIDIPRFRLHDGTVTGSAKITGMTKDPDFSGDLSVDNVDFTLPTIISAHVTVPHADAFLNHQELVIPEIVGAVKGKHPINGTLGVYFEGWKFDKLDVHVATPENSFAPVDLAIEFVKAKGMAGADINVTIDSDKYIDVVGKVTAKDANLVTKIQDIANRKPSEEVYIVRTDLQFSILQHCTFNFEPVLRAVFTPNSDFSLKFDAESGVIQMDGIINIRSGDVAYLNRNFYIKSGVLRFNPNETTFNPMISFSAEAREKDEKNNNVRLILTANNQYIFDLNPQISSIPALSEREMNQMLGNVAGGDSENVGNFLVAAGDYAIQSTVGRIVENKLRDWLHLDILSIRTSILQNALKINLPSDVKSSYRKSNEIGNYFDNSTVYIGKYFGSYLYADALLHWSYDGTIVDDKMTAGGLAFKPEIGIELESPIGNIRWNMAPDFNAFAHNKFASSTSVTLSWKWAF